VGLAIGFPVAGAIVQPFFLRKAPVLSVVGIGLSAVSFPGRFSGALTRWLRTIILMPVSGREKGAAMDAGDRVCHSAVLLVFKKVN